MKITTIIGAAVLLTGLTACGNQTHPQAYLTQVHTVIPATVKVDDQVMLGHADRICSSVDGAEGWLDATMVDYKGVFFGSNPDLVDAAVNTYCPNVGDDVDAEIADLR